MIQFIAVSELKPLLDAAKFALGQMDDASWGIMSDMRGYSNGRLEGAIEAFKKKING